MCPSNSGAACELADDGLTYCFYPTNHERFIKIVDDFSYYEEHGILGAPDHSPATLLNVWVQSGNKRIYPIGVAPGPGVVGRSRVLTEGGLFCDDTGVRLGNSYIILEFAEPFVLFEDTIKIEEQNIKCNYDASSYVRMSIYASDTPDSDADSWHRIGGCERGHFDERNCVAEFRAP